MPSEILEKYQQKTSHSEYIIIVMHGVYLVLVSMEELSVMTPVRTLVKWSTMPKRNGEMDAEKRQAFTNLSSPPYQNVPTKNCAKNEIYL